MEIGNKIFELRKQQGLSQEELAYRLGVSRQTVSKWETGQSIPDLDKLEPLCDVFKIEVTELIGSADTKEVSQELNSKTKRNRTGLVITAIALIALLPVYLELKIPNNLIAFILVAGLILWGYLLVTFLKSKIK